MVVDVGNGGGNDVDGVSVVVLMNGLYVTYLCVVVVVVVLVVDNILGYLFVKECHGFGFVINGGGLGDDGLVHVMNGCCVELCQCGRCGNTLFESM